MKRRGSIVRRLQMNPQGVRDCLRTRRLRFAEFSNSLRAYRYRDHRRATEPMADVTLGV